jgi:hypothetical protein
METIARASGMTERPTCNCGTLTHRHHLGRACSESAVTPSGLCGFCSFLAWAKKQAEQARERTPKSRLLDQ